MSWLDRAEYVTSGEIRILGEDENGDLWVPHITNKTLWSIEHVAYWDRRFNPRNPSHWSYWLRSRLTRRIAFLEVG